MLETLDRAYKTSVRKVENLMEKHMDVSILDVSLDIFTVISYFDNSISVYIL